MSESSECEYTKLEVEANISETSRVEYVVKDLSDVVYRQPPDQDRKLPKTVALFGGFFCLGLVIAILGPTIPDLLYQINANYDQLSYIFLSRGFGYMTGSIISGVLCERFNAFGLLGAFLMTCSVGMICVPTTKKLSTLMVAFIVSGTAMGGLDTGGNVLCLGIWGESSPPYMQALHFTFALGACAAPLIAKPFISVFVDDESLDGEKTMYTTEIVFSTTMQTEITEWPVSLVDRNTDGPYTDSNTTVRPPNITNLLLRPCSENGTCDPTIANIDVIGPPITNTELTASSGLTSTNVMADIEHLIRSDQGITNTESGNRTTVIDVDLSSGDVLNQGNIYIVYGIIAAITFLTALMFYYFCVTSAFRCRQPRNATKANDVMDGNDRWFRVQILAILFMFYFLYIGGEVAFGSYIYSYAINCDLKFSKDSASLLNSLFWGAFAIFRGLAIIFAYFFTPLQMLMADVVVCIGASIVLVLFANTSQFGIWFGTAVLGAAMASLFPTGLSWLERYIQVTGSDACILVVGSSFGEMIIPFVIGQYFPDDGNSQDDSENIDALMYLMLFIACLTFVILLIAYKLALHKGDRYSRNEAGAQRETRMVSL